MSESLEDAVENYLMLYAVGATPSELTEPLRAMKIALEERQYTLDLNKCMLDTLYEAAENSTWIPHEHYFVNDWISDCASFLRTGKGING